MGASLKRRAVIFGSAPATDWSFLQNYLRQDDAIICADGGRNTAERLGLHPDWYVGDDDSGGYAGNCPADLLPSEKDVTDLDMAVSRALREGYDELLLCGCTGGRQDHHFSAVGQLERCLLYTSRAATSLRVPPGIMPGISPSIGPPTRCV